MKITVSKNYLDSDGFGSQLSSILSGIIYSLNNNLEFIYTPIRTIKMTDVMLRPIESEIIESNKIISSFISNLGFRERDTTDICIEQSNFYNEITHRSYSLEILKKIQEAFPYEMLPYKKNSVKQKISIHIRRGADLKLISNKDLNHRIVPNRIYEIILDKISKNYPDYEIHVFSWEDSGLSSRENLFFHCAQSPDLFLEDFSSLVNSDMLIVGSSTFSFCAGLLNPNLVVCDKSIYKLKKPEILPFWIDNFNRYIL